MNKKRIFIVAAACLTILCASFGATYAYLISSDTEVNEFTVGRNTVEIDENYDPPDELKPGTEIKKAPRVKNTGELTCFVRMRADFSDSRAEALCEPLVIGEGWKYRDTDGYYYYTEPLEPNAETTYLFENVKIKTDAYEADMMDFDILVYAESCHYGGSGDTYETAWGLSGAN